MFLRALRPVAFDQADHGQPIEVAVPSREIVDKLHRGEVGAGVDGGERLILE